MSDKICFRPLPDEEYGNDILVAMSIISTLETIDKALLKRVIILGLHNLNADEKELVLQALTQAYKHKTSIEEHLASWGVKLEKDT